MPDDPVVDVSIDQFVPNPTTILKDGDIKRASDFRSILYQRHGICKTSAPSTPSSMIFGEILTLVQGIVMLSKKRAHRHVTIAR